MPLGLARDMRVTAIDIAHEYHADRPLFQHLSFTLLPGRLYAVTGPSGSGKSTLLSIIATWLKPKHGTVAHHNVDTIRWVFQNPYGVARRTALDHVAVSFIGRGYPRRQADESAHMLLERFGLKDVAMAPFQALSGGEAQRLMLARGMAAAPDLLLVDEPTAQLDRVTAEDVNTVMTVLAEQGAIVVIATHDDRTRDMCTDVIELDSPRRDTAHAADRTVGTADSDTISHKSASAAKRYCEQVLSQ